MIQLFTPVIYQLKNKNYNHYPSEANHNEKPRVIHRQSERPRNVRIKEKHPYRVSVQNQRLQVQFKPLFLL